jgi:tRNA threonylcarbamoyladenosine biosynthesis protein TsaB
VITLAIDTSEARGSVAVLRAGATVAWKLHEDAADYSGWLLPSVNEVITKAGIGMEQIDLIGVSTGPGSFTGLRVGLTTVKAWSEIYGKRIVGISRLEAMARSGGASTKYVAASYDAQRGQLFGAIYELGSGGAARIGDEQVVSPEEFVEVVQVQVGDERVTWVTLDPSQIENLERLQHRIAAGDTLSVCPRELSSAIGALAEEAAIKGEFSDPLTLDANYVRRSDAEIFWKGPASVR